MGEEIGKDAKGRFQRGNRLGRGNPLAGRAAKIRAALLRAMTPADAKAIAEQLIAQAKEGDIAEAREVLDRTIGKPNQAVAITMEDRQEITLRIVGPNNCQTLPTVRPAILLEGEAKHG